jgi:hypothetical protein
LFVIVLLFRCTRHGNNLKWVNKGAVAGSSLATAPLRGTQLELPEIIG